MDYDRAKSALSGTRFPDLRHVSETGSTNADVRVLLGSPPRDAEDGHDGHVVLVADHQTAGRGRLDRSWDAPPGASVLMTIGLPTGTLPAERISLLTMALSLAALEAVADLGAASVRLKWPNDLVVPDDSDPVAGPGFRKLGGLLAELVQSPSYGPSVVLGLGLNINWGAMPEALAGSAVSLDELIGQKVDRWDLVQRIVSNFDRTWLPLLEAGGVDELLDRYSRSCATIESEVRIERAADVLIGTAIGVTPIGALVVESAGEQHVVTTGDVIHLRPVDPG